MQNPRAATPVETAAAGGSLAGIVGFYFAFRIVIEFLAVKLFGADASAGSALAIGLGLCLTILVFLISFGKRTTPVKRLLQVWPVRWACLFLLFGLISFLWSDTASPIASLVYWCGLASDVALVFMLVQAHPLQEVSVALMRGFVLGACCIAAFAWAIPAQVDLRLGDEEFFNSNQIGNLCAFAIFIAQYLARSRKGKWTLAIAFLGITLVRSLSKTTIVAFLIGQGFLLIKDRSLSRRTKMLLIFSVIATVALFWGLFEAYYNVYTTAGNQAETLSGRTGIWAYVVEAIAQKPWFGHGFDSMWKVVPPFGPEKFEARHAENELLQQLYIFGIMGLVLLAGLYGSLWKQINRLPHGSLRVLLTSLLIFFLIRGFAEAEPFDLLLPLWSIVLFGLVIDVRVRAAQRHRSLHTVQSPGLESKRLTFVQTN